MEIHKENIFPTKGKIMKLKHKEENLCTSFIQKQKPLLISQYVSSPVFKFKDHIQHIFCKLLFSLNEKKYFHICGKEGSAHFY